MQNQGPSAERVSRALALADGYLDEAEDVLWTTAAEISDTAVQQHLEDLTKEIWSVQHQLNDLQRKYEK